MPRLEAGLTFTPSPQSIEILRERLQRAGFPLTEAAARSLLDAVLAVEGPRIQALTRGILHGSLETIRQTAELALSALTDTRKDRDDLVGVLKEHLTTEPSEVGVAAEEGRRPIASRRQYNEEDESPAGDDPRPVFRRRGR